MKKLISILAVLVLVLVLSGCSKVNENSEICEANGGTYVLSGNYCEGTHSHSALYYTKEEVDEMLENHLTKIKRNSDEMERYQQWCEDVWLDVPDDMMGSSEYYANYNCIDMLEWYGDNWEEIYYLLIQFNDLEDDFYTKDEIDEIDNIDYQIAISTIANIDIILYGLENAPNTLTEDEQFAYDLYTSMRELMYLELEKER